MPVDVVFQLPDGSVRAVPAEAGTTIMKAAVGEGIPGIIGECGGEMSCATCHVYVAPELPFRSMSGDESDLLDAVDERTNQSRLGCQLILRPEMTSVNVSVPG